MRQNYKRQRKHHLKRWSGNLGSLKGGRERIAATRNSSPTDEKPALNYWELIKLVLCHTGGEFIAVCRETWRRWRQKSAASTIVALKSAHLQIYVALQIWKYQLARYKERTYCLTHSGWTQHQRSLQQYLKFYWKGKKDVKDATDSYNDDMLVDQAAVLVQNVGVVWKVRPDGKMSRDVGRRSGIRTLVRRE